MFFYCIFWIGIIQWQITPVARWLFQRENTFNFAGGRGGGGGGWHHCFKHFLEYTYFSRLVKVIIRLLQPFFLFFLSSGFIYWFFLTSWIFIPLLVFSLLRYFVTLFSNTPFFVHLAYTFMIFSYIFRHAPIDGVPQDGGVGNPGKIWHCQFSNVNFPTLGSPFWVKFPPLGQTNRHLQQSLLQHKVAPESKWYPKTLCISPSVEDIFQLDILRCWQFNTHAILPKVPLNCFTQCLQQCKMYNARTWHASIKGG